MSRREKCFVPNCPNSGSKTKDKTFFFINQNLKRKWCKQLYIDNNSKRRFVCCEDHLDLNKDLENYYQWKFMKAKPRLKSTATLKNLSLDNTSSCEKPTENQSGDVETGMKNSSRLMELLLQPTVYKPKKTSKAPATPAKCSGHKHCHTTSNTVHGGDDLNNSDSDLNNSDSDLNHSDNDLNNSDNDLNDSDGNFNCGDIQTAQSDKPLDNDFEYDCNYCQKSIIGFRYVCVQCEDYDLCEACEAQRVHDTHYVLRIPDQRPQAEINEVLSRVREAVTPILIQPGLPVNVPEPEVLAEIKEEIEDPLEEDPNSRPHNSNILEESILEIPPNTDDEVDSDAVTSKPSWRIESSYSVDWDNDNDNNQIISDSDPETRESEVRSKRSRKLTRKTSTVQTSKPEDEDGQTQTVAPAISRETSKSEVPAKRPRKVTPKSSAVQKTKPEDDHGYTATVTRAIDKTLNSTQRDTPRRKKRRL